MENAQFLIVARQVHNIWKGLGKPNLSDHGANPKYKAFAKVAMMIAPWLKTEKSGRLRFDELSIFLSIRSDETFKKWMKVYEKSRTGDLIAYNGNLQKDIIPKQTREAWHLTKQSCRDLMGCIDNDMNKIANYLLGNKKISIFKDQVKDKSYDKEDAGNWISMEDYCAKKKKKEFEILLLLQLVGEKSRVEIVSLTKVARKKKVKAMKEFYHLDKMKMIRLYEALGKNYLKGKVATNVNRDSLMAMIPDIFLALIATMKATINIHGIYVISRWEIV
ncbi:unnamed protein product [Calypogeia fissa]